MVVLEEEEWGLYLCLFGELEPGHCGCMCARTCVVGGREMREMRELLRRSIRDRLLVRSAKLHYCGEIRRAATPQVNHM